MRAPLLNSHHTWECRRSQSRAVCRTWMEAPAARSRPSGSVSSATKFTHLTMPIARSYWSLDVLYAVFQIAVQHSSRGCPADPGSCSELNAQDHRRVGELA